MKISKPEILQQEKEIVFRVRVESSEGTETLWYSVEEKFVDFVTDFSDAPLVALLIPAMAKGEDVHLAGTVSERLWYNVSGPYQRLLQHVIPSLRRVKIFPEQVRARNQRASGVATGFSCGIDSYCVLADHHYSDVPPGFRVTHLLFNNVGSHGSGGERLFGERYARIAPVAERIGLPLIKVNSNLDTFYKKELDFLMTDTPRNASVSLLLQGGIGRYMYASAYSFADVFVGVSDSLTYSDTIALPLLATEVLDSFSVGSEQTRVEKTLRVAEIADSYGTLDVCVSPEKAGNCSECWKCMRTLLTLDIAKLIDRYSTSFNLDVYKHRRSEYIGSVLRSDNPLLREIVAFAKDRHYPFPLSSYLSAPLQYYTSLAKRLSRLLLQAVRNLKYSLKQFGLFKKNNEILVYWWKSKEHNSNFGDVITPYLIHKISGGKIVWVDSRYCLRPYIVASGSVLQLVNKNAIVWGAGIISQKDIIKKPRKILAVRGPCSRKRLLELGISCPEIYGDPGLLLHILQTKCRKRT
jgi:hypothetical protein